MSPSPFAVLGLGFALGLRHALDVDHLAAVSTIVSERRGLWRSSLVGAVWGLGHTTSLLAVAVVVIGLHAEIPPRLAAGLELCVAAMLIVLGTRLLGALARGDALHAHVHVHGGRIHRHPHLHPAGVPGHDHGPGARRPFMVGLVHGLAGSAGLMLAVAATIPTPALAIAHVALFGLGSVGGMAAMSTLFAVPAALAAGRFDRAERTLRLGAALASVAVGLQLGWEILHEMSGLV
jgi:hypothetical protein